MIFREIQSLTELLCLDTVAKLRVDNHCSREEFSKQSTAEQSYRAKLAVKERGRWKQAAACVRRMSASNKNKTKQKRQFKRTQVQNKQISTWRRKENQITKWGQSDWEKGKFHCKQTNKQKVHKHQSQSGIKSKLSYPGVVMQRGNKKKGEALG